jgi:hypothetical protein
MKFTVHEGEDNLTMETIVCFRISDYETYNDARKSVFVKRMVKEFRESNKDSDKIMLLYLAAKSIEDGE